MKAIILSITLGFFTPVVHAQLDYRLYGISITTGEVLEINKTTGDVTSLMDLGFVLGGKDGFDFDPSGAFLCVTRSQYSSQNHRRVRINLAAKTAVNYGTPGMSESTEGLGFKSDGDAFKIHQKFTAKTPITPRKAP